MKNIILFLCAASLLFCQSCKDDDPETTKAIPVFEDNFDSPTLSGQWKITKKTGDSVYLENNMLVMNFPEMGDGPLVELQNGAYNKSVFTMSMNVKFDSTALVTGAQVNITTDSIPRNILFEFSQLICLFSINGNGNANSPASQLKPDQWYHLQISVANKQQHVLVKEVGTGTQIVDITLNNKQPIRGLWSISCYGHGGAGSSSRKVYIDNFGIY